MKLLLSCIFIFFSEYLCVGITFTWVIRWLWCDYEAEKLKLNLCDIPRQLPWDWFTFPSASKRLIGIFCCWHSSLRCPMNMGRAAAILSFNKDAVCDADGRDWNADRTECMINDGFINIGVAGIWSELTNYLESIEGWLKRYNAVQQRHRWKPLTEERKQCI